VKIGKEGHLHSSLLAIYVHNICDLSGTLLCSKVRRKLAR
jgi:hypothetical protein